MTYIGKTEIKVKSRWTNHIYDMRKGSNTYLHNAMRLYGIENFAVVIIAKADSKERLKELEKFYIKEYNTYRPGGYNLTLGGDGSNGYKHSEETKNKLRGEFTDEHKNNISLAARGRKCPHMKNNKYAKGRTYSDDEREVISTRMLGNQNGRGLKGKPKTKEHRKNLSAAKLGQPSPMKGKNHSDESKEKISISRIDSGVAKGPNNPMFGKHHSAETKQKISDTKRKNNE